MGNLIQIFSDSNHLAQSMTEEVVVQRYLANPLLLDGLKFDLRLYIVLTGIRDDDMHAFLADEGLVRFCT